MYRQLYGGCLIESIVWTTLPNVMMYKFHVKTNGDIIDVTMINNGIVLFIYVTS